MPTKAGPLPEEAQAAIAVVRALVASRKETSNVLSVLRDYRQLEGDPLPYRKFGFGTVEEFLLASNEFVIKSSAGESTRIYIKPNRDSAHIQEMVAAQKTTKSGGPGKKASFVALRQPSGPCNSRGFSSQTTAYSRIYQQMPNSGRNNSTNYGTKRVTFGDGKTSTDTSPKGAKPTGLWSNGGGGSPKQTKSQGQMRPITKSKAGAATQQAPSGRSANSSSPETNNNSRTTKNYNLNGGSSTGGQQQQQQQSQLSSNDLRHKLTANNKLNERNNALNDLRHKLNGRNTALSRSSVEMRQPDKALPTVSSTAASTAARPGVSAAARKQLPFSVEDKSAKMQQQKPARNGNGSNRPAGGTAVAGSGRILPSTMAPATPLPLMSIVVPPPTVVTPGSMGKSVNSRLNVPKADLPSVATP
uniref:HTH OST-type domain-containing protein n=1 Tax=Anopheles maculatus TaxID=74869 RepID=A0A182SKU8_9DIPT